MEVLRRHRIPPADAALALLFSALGIVYVLLPSGEPWLAVPLILTATVPVAWRRRAPLAAAVALSAGAVVSAGPSLEQTRCGVVIPCALLVLYPLAARRKRAPALLGLALVSAALVFVSFTDPVIEPAALSFVLPLCAGVWAAGRLVRSRTRLGAQLAERSRRLEAQRRRTAALAVELERERLATALDAAARRRVLEIAALADTAAPERDTFARIETAGRAVLNDMRGLLGVLRSDAAPDRSPQPTLARLGELLAGARLDVRGERRPLPGSVELGAYRTVEHALAALDGTARTVRLDYGDDSLGIEVGGEPAGDAREALAAARERVSAHGGRLELEPAVAGRTVLRAWLPVTDG